MNELGQLQNLTFTTAPKTRRRLTRGAFISGTRAAEFMQHLWDTGLKKSCSYETLKWEYVNYFGTNDARTVERYIGRPEQTIRSRGSSCVRTNRMSGKVAFFDYSNSRKMCRKPGLLESLGYITLKPEERIAEPGSYKLTQKTGNWIAVLHHVRMSYYTEQTVFEPVNSLQESEEGSEFSKDEMCVGSLLEKNCNETISPRERVGGETVLEVSPNVEAAERTLSREIKKEEEVIDSAHTNQSSESEAGKEAQTHNEHTSEALQLLKASREASG
jgi:hypothetical protein